MTEKNACLSRVVNFPEMHAELLGYSLPDNVFFLEPGLNGKDNDAKYVQIVQPELEKKQAAKLLTHWLQWGEHFADAGGLAYFAQAGLDDFYEHTSLAIRSELAQKMVESEKQNKNHVLQKSRTEAQLLLLLAWALEESLQEFSNLEEHIHCSWTQVAQSLGLENEDENFCLTKNILPSFQKVENITQALPWLSLLEAFICYLPENTSLFTLNPHICKELLEQGVKGQSISVSDYFPNWEKMAAAQEENLCLVCEPGWILTGKHEPVDEKPWLNKKVRIILGNCQ